MTKFKSKDGQGLMGEGTMQTTETCPPASVQHQKEPFQANRVSCVHWPLNKTLSSISTCLLGVFGVMKLN